MNFPPKRPRNICLCFYTIRADNITHLSRKCQNGKLKACTELYKTYFPVEVACLQSLRCLINAHHLSYSSFQDLWKILIGHSSFRDPVSTVPQLYAFESHIFLFVKALIKAEVEPCAAQLLNGLDSYKKLNASALKKLEASKAVKGPSKSFVIGLSKYLVCMYMYMYNLMSLIASININYQVFFLSFHLAPS